MPNTRLRIVLKDGNRYFIPNKLHLSNNRFVANLFLFEILKADYPFYDFLDYHLTYFANGNYHFTLEYYNKIRKVYSKRHLYYNHVAEQESKDRNYATSDYNRRDRNNDDSLDSFMMNEALSDWHQSSLNLPIGYTCINKIEWLKTSSSINWITDYKSNLKEDLIVDINILDCSKALHINSALHSNTITPYASINYPKDFQINGKTETVGNLSISVWTMIQ